MRCCAPTMHEVRSEADIHCSAERIFDVIIDFRGQDRARTLLALRAYADTLETQEPGRP